MKNQILYLTALSFLLLPPGIGLAKKKEPLAALPNLSFPVVATDIIEVFYQKIWVDTDGEGDEDDNEWFLAYDSNNNGILDDDLDGVIEVGEDSLDPTSGSLLPILVTDDIVDFYTGFYEGQVEPDGTPVMHVEYDLDETTGCPVDLVDNEDPTNSVPDGIPDVIETNMTDWLTSMVPWFPQPRVTSDSNPNLIWDIEYVSDYANSWKAGPEIMEITDQLVSIDFIDWGNPMENTYPLIGYRFPVEIALYHKLATPMMAYKMACLENPGTKYELFGTSASPDPQTGQTTFESYYATVLTNKFIAEVWNPNGTIETIDLGPGIGPSGKMNFASASGGWVPKMEGEHRIWLHITDPLISLSGAIINNDEHYVMSTQCGPAEYLAPNKISKSGIIGNSTFIDVLVKKPNSKGGRK